MQALVEDSVFFHFRDIELLRTGCFSDAQVIAGTRVWNVHKNIVCLRSGFMSQALCGPSDAENVEVVNIQHHTEKQVERTLEFIYSGRIGTINDFSLADCVELSILGEHFIVSGMIEYAKKVLWDKLTLILEAISTIPAAGDTQQDQNAIDARLDELNFLGQFTDAVDKAYKGLDDPSQLVLGDFIWAARAWLVDHQIIEELNVKHPKFGSRVLTTMTQGPQSSFIQADGRLTPIANSPARILCINCT